MEELLKLREILDQKFSLTEFQALCVELGLDIDDLSGDTLEDRIIALLTLLRHRDEVGRLVNLIAKYRPDIDLSFYQSGPIDLTQRIRPAGAGASISNGRGGVATLGCLVASRHNPDDIYILCDGSGLYADGLSDGDIVIQPGAADGGKFPDDLLGFVSDFVVPSVNRGEGAFNLSAALASLHDTKAVTPELPDGNFLQDDTASAVGQAIAGFSRSNGKVTGEILSIDSSITVPWVFENGEQHEIEFHGLIETTPLMVAGDSGIVIFDDQYRPVGIGFAGSPEASLFFPIDRILDYFEVDIVTESFWKHYRT